MHFDAPLLEVLAPLLLVVGTLYVLGPLLPLTRVVRFLIFVTVSIFVIRYLIWRIFTTFLPASGAWYETAWVWLCFAVEAFALFDAFVLYLCFLRSTDRRPEADRYEESLRKTVTGQYPLVDVYVPTYSEPFEVLEKTITGALCLDYPNADVWVLDDGRRAWLKKYCEEKGVGYMTRPDNMHAKAGNINHALSKTNGDYIAIFDADFIVQRSFLMRTLGFFEDPKIGVVQIPHTFYNSDPLQTNLAVRESIPDDQRFFFEAIMPSRDGWDAAFCCGSNSVTRRAALRIIGDALPVQSLTEDQLLSLMLLRQGYITRYLNEPLAYGLAPEGLRAFFIQRNRWARGALQQLYLSSGPLGKGLSLMQRLLFLPTHWLSQSLGSLFGILVPLVFMWSGVLPMVNVTLETVVYYLVPMILAVVGGVCLYAPHQYFPLASQVLSAFQSFKLLPSMVWTLVKPFGHGFKVTPKGDATGAAGYDWVVFWTAATLIALTVGGLFINAAPEWRIIEESAFLSVVAMWSAYNVLVLFLVCMLSLQGTVRRSEERFEIDDPVWVMVPGGEGIVARLIDLSLSGASINSRRHAPLPVEVGTHIRLFLFEVGLLSGRVVRHSNGVIGVAFDPAVGIERDLLIRKLFTSQMPASSSSVSAWSVTAAILRSIWATPSAARIRNAVSTSPSAPSDDRLAAQSLVVPPRSTRHDLGQISAARQAFR